MKLFGLCCSSRTGTGSTHRTRGTAIAEFETQANSLVQSGRLEKTAAQHLVDCFVHNREALDLSGLGLEELPVNLLGRCEKLRRLNLSDNRLSAVPPEFFDLTQLTELDLSNNQLTALPDDLAKLQKLASLNLASNALAGSDLKPLAQLLPPSCQVIVDDEYDLQTPLEDSSISLPVSGFSKTFRWHFVAPTRELQSDEVEQAIAEFTKDCKSWQDGWQETGKGDWQKRFSDTDEMLRILLNPQSTRKGVTAIAYYAREHPIGIMLLNNKSNRVHIDALVTHPGTAGVGGALIEKAVDISVSRKYAGKVSLESLSRKSTEAYLALGFENKGEHGARGEMSLVPTDSGKWHQVNGHWQLKSYEGKRFLG
jgi:hypothetical protein